MKRPLIPVALGYVGGLLLGAAVPVPLLYLFIAAFLLLVSTIAFPNTRWWLLGPLLIAMGWTNFVGQTAPVSPNDLRLITPTNAVIATVRGTLLESPSLRLHEKEGQEFARTLVPLNVTAVTTNDTWQPAEGTIIVSTKSQLPAEFFAGRAVQINGILSPPPEPIAPGLFDYRTYLARQGIYFQLKADSARDWQSLDASIQPPYSDRFLAWGKRILALGLPDHDEPQQLLWAMTLGWKTALTSEVNEPFMKSGTMHIFAISGLHIALIAGILVSLLRVARVPREWCGFIVVPLIWFYTGATGWQSSAIRSTIMMTIIIGGWSLRRPSDLLNSLAAAALIILIWQPQQLFQASFQLSFFVVLSIALLVPPLERWRDRLLALDPMLVPELIPPHQQALRWIARVVLTSFATSLAAWLGALPLTAFYFHIFSPVTLLANLVVVPLSSLALACNLGSLLCNDWLPWVTELFNHSAWLFMSGMIGISHWSTELPGAYVYIPAPGPVTFVIYYSLLIGSISGWLWQAQRRRLTVGLLGCLALGYATAWFNNRSEARLTILPLDGGHAEYFDASGRANDWLMDCGNTNSVQFVTRPFLRAQGVNDLPRLLLTHGDLRHVGGAELIAAEFDCQQHYASQFRFRSVAYRRIFNNLQRPPNQLTTLHRGDVTAPWAILHPKQQDESDQADNGALVRRSEFFGTKILLLSDLGRAGQNLLLERETNFLRADIVVAGLPTQGEPLCEALLDAIQPRAIIVADSELPATARASARLKERLLRRNILVLHTRDHGAATIIFGPKRTMIRTMSGHEFNVVDLPPMTFPPPVVETELER